MKNDIKERIIFKLNLSPDDVESLDIVPSDDNTSDNFLLTLKRKDHVCPSCGCITQKIKDYRIRKIKCKIFSDSDTTVLYNCRRYVCPKCGKTFFERQSFTGSRKMVSPSITAQILDALKQYNSTFSSVAREFDLSVTTVIDIFDKHVQIDPKPLPAVMCWDEFYFNRHSKYKYAFMMLNFRNNAIIDILESRRTPFLDDYFFQIPIQQRNKVKIIIIDMNENYRNIAGIYFPNAKLCVDSFHVVKYFNDALNKTRKKIMRRFKDKKTTVEYRLLKYRSYLLFKSQTNVDYVNKHYERILGYHITKRALLNEILKIDPELDKIYEIKEQYLDFNKAKEETFTGIEAKEKELDKLIQTCIESEISQLIQCGKLLKKWHKEILNSFDWIDHRRLSNGPIEGKNNYVKKILNNANGYSNFQRSRNKIMYSQNHYETYSVAEHQNTVKRKGKKRGKYKKDRK